MEFILEKEMEHSAIVEGGSLPIIENGNVTECAADQTGKLSVCSRLIDIKKAREFLQSGSKDKSMSGSGSGSGSSSSNPDYNDPLVVIQELKKKLGVEKESDIYENREYREFIGSDQADKILTVQFKPKGPANTTELLNNYNIDETMKHWSIHGKKMFNKKFYYIPYQMIDFAQNKHSPLTNIDIQNLMSQGYDSFGVVINTDKADGRGKHWFCLYGDLQHKGTKDDPIVLEYFNSSGNRPAEEIYIFLENLKHNLIVDSKIYSKVVQSVTGTQIQHSKTECGMWSLLYILYRLLDKPTDYFIHIGTTDKEIIEEARKRFFR